VTSPLSDPQGDDAIRPPETFQVTARSVPPSARRARGARAAVGRSAVAAATLLCAIALVAPVPAAIAGTIGFRTDAKVTAGPGIDVNVTLTHTGDEAATDVSVRAEMLETGIDGERIDAIAPGGSHAWNLHLADQVPKGVYTIVLRVQYADQNGYKFEIVSHAAAPVGAAPAPKISGTLDVPRLVVDGRANAKLFAKKPPERSGDYEVRLVAPAGLKLEPDRMKLVFDESGKATAEFEVRNSGLLAGTSVNLYALVTGNDPGFAQTDAIRGTVRISAAAARVTSPLFYESAAAVFLLLVALELYSRFSGRPSPSREQA
jgi:hypothetical protein